MSTTVERLMVEVRADVAQAVRGLSEVDAKSDSVGKRLGGIGKMAALGFGGAALGAIGKSISLAKDFDLTMRQVGVQTGETGASIDKLGDLAKKMGAATIYSAQDAGSAMLELAKGGLSAAQIKAGALDTTLTLAAAGGLDLANSAGYVTQAMTTFGLKAGAANQVAVALAGGANASTASVESLGQALSQVGPGATNAGLSLQDTVAALAAFDNAGIKGSDAGTSLKTMLTNLVPATSAAADKMDELGINFVKSNGQFKSLTQISQILKTRMSGLSQEQRTYAMRTIFGSDATRAATVLMKNGAKGIEKYKDATKDATRVQKMAGTAMDGASGAWENFTGSLETAGIVIGQKLLPMFTDAVNYGSDFINEAVTWGPQLKETFSDSLSTAKSLVNGLKDVAGVAMDLGKFIGGLPDGVKNFGLQAGIAALVLPRLSGAVTSVTTTIGTNIARLKQWRAEMTYTATRTQATATAMTKLKAAAGAAAGVGGMMLMSKATSETNENLAYMEHVGGAALLGLAVAGPIGATAGALIGMASAQRDVKDLTKDLDKVTASYTDTLDANTGAVTRATRAKVYDTLMADKTSAANIAAANSYGVSTRDIVSASMGNRKAQDVLGSAIQRARAKWSSLSETQKIQRHGLLDTIQAMEAVSQATGDQRKHLAKDVQDARARAAATMDWKDALQGIPKKVRSELSAGNYHQTMAQVNALVKKYDLVPAQKKTIVSALGIDKGRKDLASMADAMAKLPARVKEFGEIAIPMKLPDLAANLASYKRQFAGADLKLLIQATGSDVTVKEIRKATAAARQLPRNTTLRLMAADVYPTVASIKRVARETKTLPKNVPLLFQALGVDPTRKKVKAVRDDLKGVDNVKPALRYFHDLETQVGQGEGTTRKKMKGVYNALEQGTKGARPNLSAWEQTLGQTINTQTGRARAGGAGVGAALSEGAASGIVSHANAVQIAAGNAVRAAINSMRQAADSHSPSRETAKVGKDMGKGLENGMKARKAAAAKAGRELVHSVLQEFRSGKHDAMKELAAITRYAQKSLGGDARAKIMALAKRDTKDLTALYVRQAKVTADLTAAQKVLDDRRQVKSSFVESAFGGMNGQANVLTAGWDASTIASTLTDQVAKVKEFATLLMRLRKMGYDSSIIEQIAGAGVDGGMQAAQALAAASTTDQATINTAYSTIRDTATSTSKALGASMYDSGIQAAAGLVAGLKKKRKDVEDAILAIAMAMQKALKKALGIKSPSRVMAKLGAFSAQGLVQGLLGEEKAVGAASDRLARIMARPVGQATYAKSPASTMAVSGGAGTRPVNLSFVVHNPVAEPTSRSTVKALDKVASLRLS